MTDERTVPARERYRSLDGLRGLAALVVLIHHGMLLFPTLAQIEHRKPVAASALERLISFTPLHLVWAGDEAVLIFFVLSGLAISLPVFHGSQFRWRAYYPSRLVRLYIPVGAAVIGAALLFAVSPWGPRDGGVGVVEALSPRQIVVDASLAGSASFLDNALWSLHYEVLFSLLLPLYVVIVRRCGRWSWAVALAALALSCFARAAQLQLPMFLPVFAIGVVLAHRMADGARLRDRIQASPRRRAIWTALAASGALGLVASWYPLPHALLELIAWPALLISSTVLVFLAAFWPPAVRVLTTRPFRVLGVLSFSLYLTHVPIISSLGQTFAPQHPWVAFVVSMPVSLLAAWLFTVAIEKPSHRLAQLVARRCSPRATQSPVVHAAPGADATTGAVVVVA